MTSEVSISESSISEETAAVFVPAVITLYLERRPVMIYGAAAYRAELGNNFAGLPVISQLERIGIDIEPDGRGGVRSNPTSIKILRELWPVFRGTLGTTVQIYVGSQPVSPEDTIVWQGPFDYTFGQDTSIQPLVEGAFYSLKILSTNQAPWALLSIDVDIDTVGEVYTQ